MRENITLYCKTCDKKLITNKKFCSQKCFGYSRRKGKDGNCLMCGEKFYILPRQLKTKGYGKYCSKKCQHKSMKNGKHKKCLICKKKIYLIPSDESLGRGKYCSRECFCIGQEGESNTHWKGDDVGYHGLHKWVQKKLGKPKKCERCGKSGLTGREIHWASKDHKYERNLNDWLRLCAKCHKRFDGYGGDYNYVR